MGLFSALKKTLRATVNTALLPLDVARDAITLGGASAESGKSAVFQRGKRIYDDLESALEESGE